MWPILSLVNVLSIAIGNLFQKLSMKEDKSDPVASSIIFQFLLGTITLIFALIKGYHPPPLALFPFYLISGVLYAAGTIAYFTANKFIEASEVSVLAGTGVIMTIVGSFLFLGDTLSPLQLLGVGLIFVAVIIVNLKRETFRLNQGSWYALAGISSYGLAVVSDSYIIRQYDAASYLSFICFVPGILILLLYMRRAPAMLSAMRHIDRSLIIFTFLYAIQAISFYLALEMGALVSQISAIARASIILTVILATVFLRETKHLRRKVIAAMATTIGVLMVTGL
ncbi:MAG TPA: EamA family transporter [Patescibacteria group bacterium]|nr:EamA family transporter [Patescibacteria group bacterium]